MKTHKSKKISKMETSFGGVSSSKRFKIPPLAKGNGVHVIMDMAISNEKEFNKQMKIIQDNMLQHKQQERKLKRIEGDIVKKQRFLRQVMLDNNDDVFRKKKVEEMKFQQHIQEIEQTKYQHLVEELLKLKSNSKKGQSEAMDHKQLARKDLLMKNDLQYQYEKTSKDLDLKRNEVMNLTKEYEQKIRLKELEEYTLTKRLAELALATAMQEHKAKTMTKDFERHQNDLAVVETQESLTRHKSLENKLNLGRLEERKLVEKKRRLSQDQNKTNDHFTMSIREEGRKMTDISRSLENNSFYQRNTQIDGEYLERQEQEKNIEMKLKMAHAKRTMFLEEISNARKSRNLMRMSCANDHGFNVKTEAKRLLYNDAVRHLQNSVSKQEEKHQTLYGEVRSAEAHYKKHEQECQRLQESLTCLQRDNAKRLKEFEKDCKTKRKI
ncbi:leucine-rich repeat and IQ domain-containing protein 1-like isoform X4 [Xenia sp. Carnegie-2017]|uniref:leucine-rich repeat and IQ domain-containing protein 1-like isoform X4 n=1 Tax=Xenia sp. Carnegie-2017 TaxID=2897299 RepID=UPI001F0478AF|nr:leucine-rich repeat and IQ domain-containing protein 1-like isoform X4 [Xenia sp. Carnegie-2017]